MDPTGPKKTFSLKVKGQSDYPQAAGNGRGRAEAIKGRVGVCTRKGLPVRSLQTRLSFAFGQRLLVALEG